MVEHVQLHELLDFTRDGEWGSGEPANGLVKMAVVRGTDFAAVRGGDVSSVPIRYIPQKVADRKALRPGDVLIETAGGTKDQPTGRTVYLSDRVFEALGVPVTCASFSRFLRVKSEVVEPRYLFWYLQSIYTTGEMLPYHIQHTGVARFQYTDFASQWRVPVPSMRRQIEIADVLSSFDDKIELNRRMNETLEAMAQAIFRDWFVDFGPTLRKFDSVSDPVEIMGGLVADPDRARQLADLFPASFGDSGLPKGWEERPIGGLADIVGGSTPSTATAEYWEDGHHPWATPKDLSKLEGLFLFDTERRITDAGLAKIGSGLSPEGTVLLSSRAPIGYLAVANIPTSVNQGFIAIRPTREMPTGLALCWCRENMEIIKAHANGSTFQEISKKNFRPLPVVAGGAEVTEAFDSISTRLLALIRNKSDENQTLTAIRDLLLPKLLSGEIRLADAQALAEAAA